MRKLFSYLLLLAVAGCSTSPSPVLPPVALEKVNNAFRIERVWRHDLGEGASDRYLKLTPVIADGIIYSNDYAGMVRALDISKKALLWETSLEQRGGSPLTLANDKLYVGTGAGKIIALDAKTGKTIWNTQLTSEVLSAPQVAGGVVVARCVNGHLFGLDIHTGKRLWLHEQIIPSLTLRGTATPVIYGDLVLTAFDNGRLVANNLQTGQLIWQSSIAVARGRTDLERIIDADSDPVVVDNVVYAVAYQGRLVAMQLGSGRIIWSRDIDSYAGMSVDNYRIYLTDSQGVLWALDRSTGATLWKQDALLRRMATRPTLHKQYLVVGDFNGFIHWLRRDNGKLVARVKLESDDYFNPSLDENEDLLFPKSNQILIEPIPNDNRLYAINRYGHAEAFRMEYP